MAEYLIQDTTLTGIADKIRPLLGLTGTMTPEQMQTNLTTEQANITAALAALTEKGVEVPEGANSNALAGLIAAIEAGGGAKISTGTFTGAGNADALTVQHNLGETPNVVAFFPQKPVAAYEADSQCGGSIVFSLKPSDPKKTFGNNFLIPKNSTSPTKSYMYGVGYMFSDYTMVGATMGTGMPAVLANSSSVRIKSAGSLSSSAVSSRGVFVAGVTYHWLVAQIDLSAISNWMDVFGGVL